MATINEVSKLANVSISTVSRVINNTAPVSDSTRERVFSAMQKLGYSPNLFAQGLVTNRSQTITLVLTDLTSAYFGPLVKSLERTLRAAQYNLIVSIENESYKDVQSTFQHLIGRRSDAVILFPHYLTDEQILSLQEGAPPVVLINRFIPELAKQSIMIDNRLGGQMAVEHLIDKGHRDIAFITGPIGNSESQDRLIGYRSALKKGGLVYQEKLIVEGDFKVEGGYRGTKELLNEHASFSAIFASNDQMAAGAMRALKEARKAIPEDVSLVGFDDVEYACLLTPALTTIKQPVEEMGKAAAQMAIKLAHKATALPKQNLYTPTLIERESVLQK